MNFHAEYQSKRLTAEEAVRLIEPGDHIVTPINPGEPPALLNALTSHPQLSGNWLYRMLPGYPVLDVEVDRLKQVSIFLSGQDRPSFHQGQIDLLPNHFSDIPYLLKQRSNHLVIMAAVSPMDENGYFSLGTSVSYVGFLLEEAKKIILEVNENMPRTFGEKNKIHISQVTGLIENHVQLPAVF